MTEDTFYKCPIHGNVNSSGIVLENDDPDNPEKSFSHTYCIFCLDEFFNKNVSQLRKGIDIYV